MSSLHPFLVHFPLALLTFSLGAELCARWWKKDEWSRVGWWTQVGGTLGLAAAVLSGLRAHAMVIMTPEANASFEAHEQLAFVAAAAFAGLLLWRTGHRSRIPAPYGVIYLGSYAAAVVLLWCVGYYGGELVFRYGTGVGP